MGSDATGGDEGAGAVDGLDEGAGVAVEVGAVVAVRVGAGVAEDAGIGVPVQPASSATRAIRGTTAERRIPECYFTVITDCALVAVSHIVIRQTSEPASSTRAISMMRGLGHSSPERSAAV